MKIKINFSGRAHRYTQKEIDAVVEAMQNAEPLTQGRYLAEFEVRFKEYTGAEYAFAVCNATAALEMAAQLCQFKDGDEVIIPAHTFTATAYPFMKKGAKIVWADIDLTTRVITAKTIKEKITSKTKAVVVVHLYGYAADMPEITELTFGEFGVFSFHSHKNITTLGEGGMLTVREERIAKLIPMLRHNGHCNFPFKREHYWVPAMGNVDFPELNEERLWPNNYCIGEVECALGIKLLERIDKINEEKRKRAIWFIDELKGYPELEFHRVDSKRHSYHLLAAMVANNKRDEFIKKMAYEKGIKCVVQYYPLNRYPLYRKAGFGNAECPNTDLFFDNMASFPFHHSLSDEEIQYILASTKEVLEDLKK